jgi:hypothetical protein
MREIVGLEDGSCEIVGLEDWDLDGLVVGMAEIVGLVDGRGEIVGLEDGAEDGSSVILIAPAITFSAAIVAATVATA